MNVQPDLWQPPVSERLTAQNLVFALKGRLQENEEVALASLFPGCHL